jgi:uncharacterized protein YkwD
VPAPRKLSRTVLSLLCCAALSASVTVSSASAARSGGTSPRGSRSACTRNSARIARRARTTARHCDSRALDKRSGKTVGARPARPPKTRRVKPETPPSPSTGGAGEGSGAQAAQTSVTAHAAAIAAVLATTCQNTELTPEAANIPLIRAAVLCLINRKRAENGENPLVLSAQLEEAAEGHCQELIADDYFAHVSPTGETPVDRIRETGYIPAPSDGYVIGENLAWGTYQLSTPQAIVSAWIASPGHLANILEAQYRETGIGVTPAVPSSLAPGAPGATYAQEFGVIIP